MKEIYCIVSGIVQIVRYREFTERKAKSLGINGIVHNLSDGTVEVKAQGSKEKLDIFIKHLEKGSLLSHVENIEITWKDPKESFNDFSILF